jgi:predicted nucleotide-binding protein (sugar kinase/HSP70/actin superfamily)
MINETIYFGYSDFEKILNDFVKKFNPQIKYTNKEKTVVVYLLEEFYFRIESNLAATVIFEKISENEIKVVIIVAGGGHGLWQISWGAEKNLLRKIKEYFITP